MTTKGEAQKRRKLLVRLSVLATSSVALAASWLGVMQADGAGDSKQVTAAAISQLSTAAAMPQQSTIQRPAAAPGLVPAPAATRQVVVVRRSRAS